jgi:flagellar biosynthesis/type III secretory pathway protein FliH
VFDFDRAAPNPQPSGPSEEWQEGHAAGYEEARVLFEADAARVSVELVQTLSDMGFGYAEAQADLLNGLVPLCDALIAQFLPEFARQALVPVIRDQLVEVAAAGLDEPLLLSVAPDQIVAISDALAAESHLNFTARSDPSLGAGQALISASHSERLVDLDAVLALAKETLMALVKNSEERSQNG